MDWCCRLAKYTVQTSGEEYFIRRLQMWFWPQIMTLVSWDLSAKVGNLHLYTIYIKRPTGNTRCRIHITQLKPLNTKDLGNKNTIKKSCLAVLACCFSGFDVSWTVLKPCGSAEIPSRGFFDLLVFDVAGCNTDRYLSNSLSSLRIMSSLRRSSCSKAIILLSLIFNSLFFSCKACCSSRKLPILEPDRFGTQKQPLGSAKGLASLDPEFIWPLGLLTRNGHWEAFPAQICRQTSAHPCPWCVKHPHYNAIFS